VPEPAVIAPEGELDLLSVPALVARLNVAAQADQPRVILDLSAVTLVDSTALGAIMDVQHRFNGQGRKLSVVAPNGSAAVVMLELTGAPSAVGRHVRGEERVQAASVLVGELVGPGGFGEDVLGS
jgi:anti-sigma B factor antagonist